MREAYSGLINANGNSPKAAALSNIDKQLQLAAAGDDPEVQLLHLEALATAALAKPLPEELREALRDIDRSKFRQDSATVGELADAIV